MNRLAHSLRRPGALGRPATLRRRTNVCLRTLALVAAAFAAACGESEHPLARVEAGEAVVTGRGVLVIVVDGLRWDHTSLAGYDRDTTPFLRRFAEDAMVFSNAWSASTSLVGSHVAILSGCDPVMAQPPDVRAAIAASRGAEPTDEDAWFVPEDLHLLGRPFLGNGWRTAAFVDHPMIAELRGFDRGFRDFVEFGGDPESATREIGVLGVGRRFVDWLKELPLDQDWFAYVHMNDLERAWIRGARNRELRGASEGVDDWRGRKEFRYVPPLGLTEPLFHALPPSRANRARPVTLAEYELRYDRGIRLADATLNRLIGTAETLGRGDDITIVIAGSFGTGLGEHGLYLQAGLAETVDLHVPLLIRPSRAIREQLGWGNEGPPPRARSASLVGLVDIAPTLVDLAGVGTLERIQGTSLRPILDGTSDRVRSRVMARSSVLPGFAVIEGTTSRSAYDPSLASPIVARSWTRGADATGGPQGDPRIAKLWRLWDGLLEEERRVLHFGIGSSDRARADEIRALQGVSAQIEPTLIDGTPEEEARARSQAGGPGGDGADRDHEGDSEGGR